MRVLLTGAGGQLGPYLVRELERRGKQVVGWAGRHEVNLADPDALAHAFRHARPQVVLHTAALSKPGLCYHEPHHAEQVNVDATRQLAELAAAERARLIFTSTDLVFDGEKGLYAEDDAPQPLSVYGRTKRDAEQAVLSFDRAMAIRLSLLFGPGLGGARTLFDQQLAAMRAAEPVKLFDDEWRTPLALPLAAEALADACEAEAAGLFHLAGPQRVSRLELGRIMADAAGLDGQSLVPCSRLSIASNEPRPRDTSLRADRWRQHLPTRPLDIPLHDAITTQLKSQF